MATAGELYAKYIAEGLDPSAAATRARMELNPTNYNSLASAGYTPSQATANQTMPGQATADQIQAAMLGAPSTALDSSGIFKTGPARYTDNNAAQGMTFENIASQKAGLGSVAMPQQSPTPMPMPTQTRGFSMFPKPTQMYQGGGQGQQSAMDQFLRAIMSGGRIGGLGLGGYRPQVMGRYGAGPQTPFAQRDNVMSRLMSRYKTSPGAGGMVQQQQPLKMPSQGYSGLGLSNFRF